MINIIDSYSEILKMTEKPFDMERWKKYCNSISPEITKKCLKDSAEFNFNAQCLTVLNNALSKLSDLNETHEQFLLLTNELDSKAKKCFNCEINADIVFYIGLCNGAGWATKINKKPTILIGAEKILELNWQDKISMAGLIYHELGHLLHFQNRTRISFKGTNSAIWQLYTEGMAMFAEQNLIGNPSFFHQYDEKWLSWCKNNEKRMMNEYLKRIKENKSIQDFFGDWHNIEGYSDVGYYLGSAIIKRLSINKSYKQLCNCSKKEILNMLIELTD